MFRNVGTENSEAGESPKRKNTTFRTQRNFEIKKYLEHLKIMSGNDLEDVESLGGMQEAEEVRR